MRASESVSPQRQAELIALLAPIHDRAVLMARRIAGSNADGDDLFQEAVLRAMAKLPTLREPDKFSLWFYKILLSVHRTHMRRSFWNRFVPFDDARDTQVKAAYPPAEWSVGARRAQEALARLSRVQREAIVLHEIQEFSVAEIAEIQGVSASAVKSRLARSRAKLRRYYEKNDPLVVRAMDTSMVSESSTLSR